LELTQLQQGFVTDGMGFWVKLHGNNFEAPMSALGQKQTFTRLRPMSALPPKADIGTGPRYQLRRDNSANLAIFAAIRRALVASYQIKVKAKAPAAVSAK
jgi:hypothetical protein